MAKTKLVCVRLDLELARELRVYAAENATTAQAILEAAVIATVRRRRTIKAAPIANAK